MDSSSTSTSSDHVHWRPAAFADGRSGGPRRTTQAIARRDGLHIAITPNEPPSVWNYAELATSTPIGLEPARLVLYPKSADTVGPRPTLLVDDPRLIEDLRRRAPHLCERQGDRDRLGLAAVALVLIGLIGVLLTYTSLSFSALVAEAVPERVWERVGARLRQQLVDRSGRRCLSPDGLAALDRITAKLTAGLDKADHYDVWVVDWPIVNAFALPGRRIVATHGLIAAARAPSHVAGVLAHEIGHGELRHPEARLLRAFWSSLLIQIISGASGGELLIGASASLLQLRYDRAAEREADAAALEILRSARIPATALTAVLEITAGDEETRASAFAPGGILSTHPATRERIAATENAPRYPEEPILSNREFQDLKRICNPVTP